jgi:type IV pilus assembly protein PilO
MPLPAFLDPIVNAPRHLKLLLGIIGLVVIALGGYFLVISPAQTRLSALERQRANLERELVEARSAVADLVRFRRETAEIERRLEAIAEKLPTQRELPPLYRTTYEAAAKAGLGVALFQPREPRVQDYYTEIPIAVTAEGTYHQLGKFFESTAGFSRVVNVSDVKMTGLGRGKSTLRADMTLATYVYRPVGSPPAPKPGAVGTPAPPAHTPAPTPAATPPRRSSIDPKMIEPGRPAPPA